MRENRNSGWKFWLGLAAGVAAGMYLNSEEGRRVRRETGQRLSTWGQDVNEKVRNQLLNLSNKASDALQKSKGYADRTRTDLKTKIEKFSSAAENIVDRTEETYEKAADWATSKLNADKK